MANNDLSYDEIIAILDKANKEESERRKKRDIIGWLPFVLSLVSWGLIIAEWFVLDRAAPPRDYGWLSLFGYYAPNEPWPARDVNVAFMLLLGSIGLCVAAFFINKMRMRRKGDKYSAAVIIISSVTFINFIIFLIQFIPMGILGRF